MVHLTPLRSLSIALTAATVFVTALGAASVAQAGEPATDSVDVLVVRENGVGTAEQAQGFIDRLMTQAAKVNGWAAASGKYVTSRTAAEGYIHGSHPTYAFLSLGAFLGLRGRHQLEVIGSIEVAQAGEAHYHVISAKHTELAGCKGKSLATNHSGDLKFIDGVVAGGAFKLADFDVVTTRRPLQTLKQVIDDRAECALIDDAQLEALKVIDGGVRLKPVWSSATLPPMVAVAFPTASSAQKKGFQGNFKKICAGEGAPICKEAGIKAMRSASDKDYQAVIRAYDANTK